MARCNAEEDCDAGIRMICSSGRCQCNSGDLFFEWPKYGCFSKVHMFGQCDVSGQCVAMNPNTYCNPDNGRCTCSPNFFYNGRECRIRYDGSNLKAQEIYKAAVVAAACFIVAVVGIFVACIVRRSFCRRDQHLQQTDPNRESDIFSISDEIAALRAVDKPPSYEEVLQIERTFYGIPPPEYTATRSISSSDVFRPASTPLCAPGQASHFNLPYSAAYVPAAEASSAGDSELTSSKVVHQERATPSHHPSDSPTIVPPANFLAAADVLPPPPDPGPYVQIDIPTAQRPSDSSPHAYISCTPPPRLHKLYVTPASSSSMSLPGSPNLRSMSSQLRVLNLPDPREMELLKKKNSLTSTCSSLFHSPDGSSPDGATCSEPQNTSIAPPHETGPSPLAYDNLGYVPDHLHE